MKKVAGRDTNRDPPVDADEWQGLLPGDGAAGQFLQTDGAAMTWADVVEGIYTLQERKTFSGAGPVTFSSLPSASHWLLFLRMKDASGSRKGPAIQVNGDGGSNYMHRHEDGTNSTGNNNYRWANWGTETDDVTASLIGINGIWSSHCAGRIIIPGSDFDNTVGFRNGNVTSPLSQVTLLQDQTGSITGEAELYFLDVQT